MAEFRLRFDVFHKWPIKSDINLHTFSKCYFYRIKLNLILNTQLNLYLAIQELENPPPFTETVYLKHIKPKYRFNGVARNTGNIHIHFEKSSLQADESFNIKKLDFEILHQILEKGTFISIYSFVLF